MNKKCEYCKKEFKIKNKYPNQRFCSIPCKNRGITTRNGKIKVCLTCSDKFYTGKASTQKYCSVKCKNNTPVVEIKCVCKDCKKDFIALTKQPYRPPLCCKQCIQKKSRNRHGKSKHYNNRRLVLSVSKCEICGYKKNSSILGVHHMDKNRMNNDRSNLKVLCPNCHSLEHAKHIPHSLVRQTS